MKDQHIGTNAAIHLVKRFVPKVKPRINQQKPDDLHKSRNRSLTKRWIQAAKVLHGSVLTKHEISAINFFTSPSRKVELV